MILRLTLFLTASLCAADWPAFRGPNASGVAADDKAPADLTLEKGLAWKTRLPAGNSSPIVAGNRVFVTAWEGDNRILMALDAATGKESWRRSFPKTRVEFAMPENGHATPSPVSDGSNVYAVFHDAGLLSLTAAGKERWRVDLGPFISPYGLASSLAFADGSIFLWTDLQDQSILRAYDAATGKLRWTAKQLSQSGGGYSSPVVYRPPSGPAQVIVYGAGETAGYQVSTGERLWTARGLTSQPAATPIIFDGTLFVVSPKEAPYPWSEVAPFDVKKDGNIPLASIPAEPAVNVAWKRLLTSMDEKFGNGDGILSKAEFEKAASAVAATGGLYAIPLSGKSDLSEAARWHQTKSMPYFASPLIYRDVLYTVKDGGVVSAFDPADGKLHKQGRLPNAIGQYWSSPVAGAGKLFFVNAEGKLSVVRAGAEWEPVSTTDLGERVIAVPALAGGRLYVRGDKTLYCFGR